MNKPFSLDRRQLLQGFGYPLVRRILEGRAQVLAVDLAVPQE